MLSAFVTRSFVTILHTGSPKYQKFVSYKWPENDAWNSRLYLVWLLCLANLWYLLLLCQIKDQSDKVELTIPPGCIDQD